MFTSEQQVSRPSCGHSRGIGERTGLLDRYVMQYNYVLFYFIIIFVFFPVQGSSFIQLNRGKEWWKNCRQKRRNGGKIKRWRNRMKERMRGRETVWSKDCRGENDWVGITYSNCIVIRDASIASDFELQCD